MFDWNLFNISHLINAKYRFMNSLSFLSYSPPLGSWGLYRRKAKSGNAHFCTWAFQYSLCTGIEG